MYSLDERKERGGGTCLFLAGVCTLSDLRLRCQNDRRKLDGVERDTRQDGV